jgi:hypothetical protein
VIKLIKLHSFITAVLYFLTHCVSNLLILSATVLGHFMPLFLKCPNDHKQPSIFYLLVYDAFSVAEYCHMITNNVFEGGIFQNWNSWEVPLNETYKCTLFPTFSSLQHTFYTSSLHTFSLFSSSKYLSFLIYANRSLLITFQVGLSCILLVQAGAQVASLL